MDLRDIFILVSLIAVTPLALVKPQVGLLAWLWISIMNPQKETYGFMAAAPILDAIAISTLIGCVLHWNKRAPSQFLPVLKMMLAFYVWISLTTLFAVNPEGAREDWIEFSKTMLLVFLILQFMNKRHWTIAVIGVFILSMSYTSVKGGLFTIVTGGGHRVWGPPTTMWGSNNGVSLAMVMLVPVCIGFASLFEKKLWRLAFYGIAFTSFVAVLGTQSRGGLVGLLALAGTMVMRSNKKTLAMVLVHLVLVAGFMFMPQSWHTRMATILNPTEDGSANSRLIQWKYAIDISLERPLFGNGFEAFFYQPYYYRYVADKDVNRSVHSNVFQILGEQGYVGLLMYLAIITMLVVYAHRYAALARGSPGMKWTSTQLYWMQFSVIGCIANGLTLNLAYLDLFYFVLAFIALLISQVREELGETTGQEAKSPRFGAGRRQAMAPRYGRPGYGPPGYGPPRQPVSGPQRRFAGPQQRPPGPPRS